MKTYLVLLFEPNDKIFAEIKRQFPDSREFRISDTIYVVKSDKTASQITEDIGLDGNPKYKLPTANDSPCGIVVRWSNIYYGYASEEFWDWVD